MFKKIASITAILALASTLAAPAFASPAQNTISASLFVVPECTFGQIVSFPFSNIGAGPIQLSNLPVTASGSISYTCSGTVPFLELSDGSTNNQDFTLSNGGYKLPFTISENGFNNNETFTNGGGSISVPGGNNTIYLTAALDTATGGVAQEGLYSDNVTATLSFS